MKITEKMFNSLPKPTERLQTLENNIIKTLYTVLINRKWIGVLQDYFRMKNITNYKTLRNDHNKLETYETTFNRKLTRMDAVIISPLSESEINKIINSYHNNKELIQYQTQKSEDRLKLYYQNLI